MIHYGRMFGVVIAVPSLVVSAVLYMEDVKSRIEKINHSVDENILLLQEVRGVLTLGLTQRENRFEDLEAGHINLLNPIATSSDDLNFRLGVLSGRMLERDQESCTTNMTEPQP